MKDRNVSYIKIVVLLMCASIFCSPAPGACQTVTEMLSFQQFKDNVEILSGFGDRWFISDGNHDAVEWIAQQLAEMGYTVERMPFDSFGNPTENIWVTQVGTVSPDQMYIVSAHLDGVGNGGAADDDASGVSLVLELARVLSLATSEVSIRLAFWNSEEVGCVGSESYVENRAELQGVEEPPGSGLYPEPSWLGVIQHDMILYDHGLPPQPEQIAEADIDIEYDLNAGNSMASLALAEKLMEGNIAYSEDYPAEIGDDMCCTDSRAFTEHTAAVSVRENRRREEIGLGSNPHYHQSTDVFASYSDADFRLGFNAAQMTLGTLVDLAVVRPGSLFRDGFETGDISQWQ